MNTLSDKASRAWLDEMATELRLRNTRGTAIGDAIAQVETYCADSGQSPQEAFGDPREYAQSLAFPPREQEHTSAAGWSKLLVPVAIGLLGVGPTRQVVTAAIKHTPVQISWGDLGAAIALVVVVAITALSLRAVVQRPLVAAPLFGLAVVGIGLLPVLVTRVAFTMPLWLGIALMAVALGLSVVLQRLSRDQEDPIVDPRAPKSERRGPRLLTDWIFVIVALAIAAMTLVTTR